MKRKRQKAKLLLPLVKKGRVKKIDYPYYANKLAGQFYCKSCNAPVKNDWIRHVNRECLREQQEPSILSEVTKSLESRPLNNFGSFQQSLEHQAIQKDDKLKVADRPEQFLNDSNEDTRVRKVRFRDSEKMELESEGKEIKSTTLPSADSGFSQDISEVDAVIVGSQNFDDLMMRDQNTKLQQQLDQKIESDCSRTENDKHESAKDFDLRSSVENVTWKVESFSLENVVKTEDNESTLSAELDALEQHIAHWQKLKKKAKKEKRKLFLKLKTIRKKLRK